MSITWTQQVDPDLERWLGKPVTVVEASTCDLCGAASTWLRRATGWSWSAGETVDVSLCPECAGNE